MTSTHVPPSAGGAPSGHAAGPSSAGASSACTAGPSATAGSSGRAADPSQRAGWCWAAACDAPGAPSPPGALPEAASWPAVLRLGRAADPPQWAGWCWAAACDAPGAPSPPGALPEAASCRHAHRKYQVRCTRLQQGCGALRVSALTHQLAICYLIVRLAVLTLTLHAQHGDMQHTVRGDLQQSENDCRVTKHAVVILQGKLTCLARPALVHSYDRLTVPCPGRRAGAGWAAVPSASHSRRPYTTFGLRDEQRSQSTKGHVLSMAGQQSSSCVCCMQG